MNRRVLVAGLLVTGPLIALLAVAFRYDPNYIASPLIGKPAPNFRLVDLEGEVSELAALRGKPVVINFWATYCPPCIVEHPLLTAAAEHYRGRVHFLGVIYQDDEELIRRFVEQRGSWGPSLIDPDGKVAIGYGVYGPPETFFIDRDGTIVDKVIGQVHGDHLVETLEELLS